MSKPMIHAISSSKKFGGLPENYLEIHQLLDSSKGSFGDNRHRALTHNAWFIGADGILEKVFGPEIFIPREGHENEFYEAQSQIDALQRKIDELRVQQRRAGRGVSTRDLGEQHVLEDFQGQFIPTAADYLENMDYKEWMSGGRQGTPSSYKKLADKTVVKVFKLGD